MSVREARIGDIPIRLFRVSFTGEAGFEINLPPGQAQRVWDTLLQHDVTPYGTDAMHMLRAEKGYIIVGQETDTTVTPDDVGLRTPPLPARISSASGRCRCPTCSDRTANNWSGFCRPIRQWCWKKAPRCTVDKRIGQASRRFPGGRTVGRDRTCDVVLWQRHVEARFCPGDGGGWPIAIGSTLGVPMLGGAVKVSVTDPVFVDKARGAAAAEAAASCAWRTAAARDRSASAGCTPRRYCSVDGTGAHHPHYRVRAGSGRRHGDRLRLGVLLPTVPCRSVISRDRAALWLGPDEWLIVAPESASGLADQATKAVGDHPASIVDVSHAVA